MDTRLTQRWHDRHDFIAEDQHPGCHTHASGFDYVAHYNAADKEIDKVWARELLEARQKLLRTLLKKS
jgi:hypothetical protein